MAPLLDYPPVTTLSLGSLKVYTWGIFVALGMLTVVFLSARRARRMQISTDHVWNLAFWVTLGGIVGARIAYVLEYWDHYSTAPIRVFAFWEGGLSVLGGIVLGLAAGAAYARRARIEARKLASVIAPFLLLGDAIGRIGGALSHMYAGRPTSFFLSYLLGGIQRHEVGIELALASFTGFLVLLWLARRRTHLLPVLVLLWYSLERFLLDFLRASDLPLSDARYAGLTLAQYAALVGIVVGAALLVRARITTRRSLHLS